jgi:3-demethoxyubiquinol 3-hydroxylase
MAFRSPTATDLFLQPLARALNGEARATETRTYPAATQADDDLPAPARRHAAGLMRVNHAGEIAAQGLYHGQALTARNPDVAAHLHEAAVEERDHMAWCEQRLTELGSQPSVLSPLWYAGSFAMGAAAGLAGDRWNLGFVAETERQVAAHLSEHLTELPPGDARSRAVVHAMREDETRHGAEATAAGGVELPWVVKRLMHRVAGVMKWVAYYR